MLELFYGRAEFRFVSPAVVPNVKLQQVDGVDPQLLANEIGVLEDMLRRKNIAVFIFGQRGPPVVGRRNLRRGVNSLTGIARHDLAQQAVALALTIGPGRVEKVTPLVDRRLHRGERFFVVRTAPAAHTPQSVSNIANFETGTAELAVFHDGIL